LLGDRLSLVRPRAGLGTRAAALNLDGTVSALETTLGAQAVVVVEGMSDQLALETLATRRGHKLNALGIFHRGHRRRDEHWKLLDTIRPKGAGPPTGRYVRRR